MSNKGIGFNKNACFKIVPRAAFLGDVSSHLTISTVNNWP